MQGIKTKGHIDGIHSSVEMYNNVFFSPEARMNYISHLHILGILIVTKIIVPCVYMYPNFSLQSL